MIPVFYLHKNHQKRIRRTCLDKKEVDNSNLNYFTRIKGMILVMIDIS